MNRRSFLKSSALALFGFSVLPSATTYKRLWQPSRQIVAAAVNPAWVNAPYELLVVTRDKTAYLWERKSNPAFPEKDCVASSVRYQRNPMTGLFERVEPFITTSA